MNLFSCLIFADSVRFGLGCKCHGQELTIYGESTSADTGGGGGAGHYYARIGTLLLLLLSSSS